MAAPENMKSVKEMVGYQRLCLLGMHPGKDIKEITKSIYKSYPPASGFLKQVQQCNLHLLKDFKQICDTHNAKFWLHAGTLIGALRHDGLIPWDDDVDVGMNRDDFTRIQRVLANDPNLILHEYYNEVTCSRQYQLKYRNGVPVFIDVVVYDICNARTPYEQTTFWNKYRKERRDMLHKFKTQLKSPKIIDVGYNGVGLYAGKIKEAVDGLIDRAIAVTSESPQTDRPSYFYSIANYPFTYPIMKFEDLYPLQLVKFEDTEFYIPANPEFYLHYGYGNIWLPPEDIGKNPHTYAFKKYQEEIDDFLKNKTSTPGKKLEEYYESVLPSEECDVDNIEPIFNKNAVCVSCSEFYAKYLSILLLSIIENSSPDNSYDIIVLTTDMTVDSKRIIENLTDKENIKIRIFNITEKIQQYQFYTWAHFTPNTYYRLSIPELLRNYDKVLYLDSDTIVNADISELFEVDLGENYIAAAKDTHVLSYCNGYRPEQLEYNTDVLKLANPLDYFQMGVSLYNIKKFNSDYNKNLLELASQVQYKWLDQDILNVEFQGAIKELSIEWNVMILNKPPYLDEYYLPEEYRTKYCEARFSPKIIHYCGGVYFRKPFLPDFKNFFWKYALKSPFFGDILLQLISISQPKAPAPARRAAAPVKTAPNAEILTLRHEFEQTHFPNINNHFAKNERDMKLIFIIEHLRAMRFKKLYYRFRMAFAFGKKFEKYSAKHEKVKALLEEAQAMKKSLFSI